ncbi:hypothetical protein AAFF_G00220180 [Aldrovandia affinis]|uniref:Uncharacterized protein n=1 Tax=Aldrovandia affinis TaxID=143900 RepID=A0AAD7W434_9TELE|nr:hypothetical protein AAFF_G00220180 [Aldrovandia affinis]
MDCKKDKKIKRNRLCERDPERSYSAGGPVCTDVMQYSKSGKSSALLVKLVPAHPPPSLWGGQPGLVWHSRV